jgi:hypothetical protein
MTQPGHHCVDTIQDRLSPRAENTSSAAMDGGRIPECLA